MSREKHMERVKARLEAWNAEIDRLESQARPAAPEARVRFEEGIRLLRRRRDEAEEHLRTLLVAEPADWPALAPGIDVDWERIREGFDAARAGIG